MFLWGILSTSATSILNNEVGRPEHVIKQAQSIRENSICYVSLCIDQIDLNYSMLIHGDTFIQEISLPAPPPQNASKNEEKCGIGDLF
jgi:hypothetical protein